VADHDTTRAVEPAVVTTGPGSRLPTGPTAAGAS
jgi:hypothetical protein